MINIIAPWSITENNVYSYSEIIYLSGYLKKNGFQTRVKLIDISALKNLDDEWLKADTIFIIQFIDKEILKWLESCSCLFVARKILYGFSAQVYYEEMCKEYKFDLIVSTNSYEAIIAWLNKGEVFELEHTPNEIQYPDFSVDGLCKLPYIPIISSRGCKRNCSFCAISCANKFTHIYISRSAEDIFNEIKYYYNNYGKNRFYFVDSCFLYNELKSHIRIKKFIKLLKESKLKIKFSIETRADCVDANLFAEMKTVGLSSVLLGIENLNENVLARYNKQLTFEQIINAVNILKIQNIHIELSMILFDPFTTKEEFMDNIDGILNNELYNYFELPAVFRKLVIIPNNKLKNVELIQNSPYSSDSPQWYSDSVNYTINDTYMQNLSEAIDIFYKMWIADVNLYISKIKDILKIREIRIKRKKTFFLSIKHLLEQENIPNEVNEFIQRLYDEEKKVSMLEGCCNG